MKFKLKSGKEIEVKDLTVDERDDLLDSVSYEGSGDTLKVSMMHSTMTKFIRIGLKGDTSDKFLKTLTLEDRTEIFTKMQSYYLVGEEKASK